MIIRLQIRRCHREERRNLFARVPAIDGHRRNRTPQPAFPAVMASIPTRPNGSGHMELNATTLRAHTPDAACLQPANPAFRFRCRLPTRGESPVSEIHSAPGRHPCRRSAVSLGSLVKLQAIDYSSSPFSGVKAAHIQNDVFVENISGLEIQPSEIRQNGNFLFRKSVCEKSFPYMGRDGDQPRNTFLHETVLGSHSSGLERFLITARDRDRRLPKGCVQIEPSGSCFRWFSHWFS